MTNDLLDKIIHADCREVFKNIENESIDCIPIDPPYNIKKADWDYFDSEDYYIDYIGGIVKECARVLKKTGTFYLFHNDIEVLMKIHAWIATNTDLKFKQLITWSKMDPNFKNWSFVVQRLSTTDLRNYYKGFTEYCLFYVKQKDEEIREETKAKYFKKTKEYFKEELEKSGLTVRKINKKLGCNMGSHIFTDRQWQFPTKHMYEKLDEIVGGFSKTYDEVETLYDEEYKEYLVEYRAKTYTYHNVRTMEDFYGNSNVWHYPNAKNLGHITPKPVEMMENILKHTTNEGDIVLDCFAGSGTVGVACKKLNRRYILIEKEQKYIDLINVRLEEEV